MSEPTIHPIERIRDAFERVHKIATGEYAHYMSIPPNPERDADLILTDAIEELATLRARVAELQAEVERVRGTLARAVAYDPALAPCAEVKPQCPACGKRISPEQYNEGSLCIVCEMNDDEVRAEDAHRG